MSLFNEQELRNVIAEEVRKIMREEMARTPGNDAYLSVAGAATLAAVVPDTIREWIQKGDLGRYHAGRELRVRRSDLEAFLTSGRGDHDESTPEQEAQRFLARRAARDG